MATDALTAAADELYALVPDEFTAARNARAKAAKPADAELARRIGALRRPSPAAWLVNRLAREQSDALDELLDLGDALREAQAAGDGRALTRLGAERRRLVSALLGQAGALTDAADRTPSRAVLDEVEQTLVAGTVDAAAGEAVRTGRLVRSLQAVGLDRVDLDGAVAGGPPSTAPSRKPRPAAAATLEPAATDDATAEADAAARAQRERAEAELRDALRLADEAGQALTAAEDALADAERHADELRAERQELDARLRALRTEITEAERAERDTERTRAKAATAADRADDAVDAAQQALEELG